MKYADRDALASRIRQVRQLASARDRPAESDADGPADERVRALEDRVAQLEKMVEGLQDSVHRESERHAKLIAELQAQVEPAAMSAALADDARHRGL